MNATDKLEQVVGVLSAPIIKALLDSLGPPIPPVITREQAAHMAEALVKG